MTRSSTTLLLSLSLVVALASCGDDEPSANIESITEASDRVTSTAPGPESEPPPASTTASDTEVETVTVAHAYGSSLVPADPDRVVTLGLSDHDTALALGVVPVGVVDWFGERPYGQWPWVADLWAGTEPEIVGERDDINYEAVTALDPDLIVAAYSGISQEQYDILSEIAPVVAQPANFPPYAAPWQELTMQVGRALNQEDHAAGLVAQVEAEFSAVVAAHPEWKGLTAVVADPYEPGQWAVFASADPKSVFLQDLGFTAPVAIDEAAPGQTAAVISSERTDLLDADRIVFLSSSDVRARVEADPLFNQLPAAQAGDVLFLSYEEPPLGAALSFNTVLSIPWAIEQIVPLLEGT